MIFEIHTFFNCKDWYFIPNIHRWIKKKSLNMKDEAWSWKDYSLNFNDWSGKNVFKGTLIRFCNQ